MCKLYESETRFPANLFLIKPRDDARAPSLSLCPRARHSRISTSYAHPQTQSANIYTPSSEKTIDVNPVFSRCSPPRLLFEATWTLVICPSPSVPRRFPFDHIAGKREEGPCCRAHSCANARRTYLDSHRNLIRHSAVWRDLTRGMNFQPRRFRVNKSSGNRNFRFSRESEGFLSSRSKVASSLF